MSRHRHDRCHAEDESFAQLGATPREQAIRRRVRRMARFYRHLMVYVAVITGLWIINAVQVWSGMGPQRWGGGNHFAWWAIWPTLGWGIAIALGAVSTFGGRHRDDWEERKVQELMQREGA